MIKFNSEKNIFTVETPNTALILQPDRDGRLRVLHYGKKISNPEEVFYILPTVDKYISSSPLSGYSYQQEYHPNFYYFFFLIH